MIAGEKGQSCFVGLFSRKKNTNQKKQRALGVWGLLRLDLLQGELQALDGSALRRVHLAKTWRLVSLLLLSVCQEICLNREMAMFLVISLEATLRRAPSE